MPLPNPSVEELVVTLRLSKKSNIVVEGDDDVIIYQELVKQIGILEVVLLSCGGRDKLLQVYERRGEFAQMPVAFIRHYINLIVGFLSVCFLLSYKHILPKTETE